MGIAAAIVTCAKENSLQQKTCQLCKMKKKRYKKEPGFNYYLI